LVCYQKNRPIFQTERNLNRHAERHKHKGKIFSGKALNKSRKVNKNILKGAENKTIKLSLRPLLVNFFDIEGLQIGK
jgi:hypothetical protein